MKKIKNRLWSITTAMVVAGATVSSCTSPSKKVENATEKVYEAEKELDEANKAYLEDMADYRLKMDKRIRANNQSVAEFNARIANEKMEQRLEHKEKIAELDKKNADMKKKMDDYKAEGKEQWENFKAEFDRDMEELGKSFKDLTVKNVK